MSRPEKRPEGGCSLEPPTSILRPSTLAHPAPGEIRLKVKIGVADADRVVEIETEDPDSIRQMIDNAFATGDEVLWFEDTKKRLVGIPRNKVAFVEIEQEPDARSVGFARASS